MSQHYNQELSSWKDVLCSIRRVETRWRGIPLSPRDHLTYTEAILMWAMVLNDLSNRYEGFGSKRDHVNFAHSCVKVDVGELANFVSEAIVEWRRASVLGSPPPFANYADFKRRLAARYSFAGALLGPMQSAVGYHLRYHTPNTFYPVYQALSFMNHLSLRDIDMSQELEDGYLEHEKYLATISPPEFLVQRMNEVMREWFHDFSVDVETFRPKHGPGGIAEIPKKDATAYEKYRLVQPDSLIRDVFRIWGGIDADEYAPCRDARMSTSRVSRVVFVPKSMKTKRTISMEPATLQYFQQGVDRSVRQYIAKHPYLSCRIDLNDQTKQCEAAIDASRTRDRATVDLSAASDSVKYDLVKRVFRGTALLPYLVALRSRSTVLPSGNVVELTKYAPMGSALTFPVETLIFACIAECTARYVSHVSGVKDHYFRVYGDDIIVPNVCLDDLVVNLRWCGFRINESKTYAHDHMFRESCGCDAFDGIDVTPMKIGRKFSADRVTPRTPDVFAALIDMANSSMYYGFLLLRRYIVDKLVNGTKYIPLFSEDVRYGVYSPQPSNYRTTKRWNDDYQREESHAAVTATFAPVDSPLIQWNSHRRTFEASGATPSDWDDIRYFDLSLRTPMESVGEDLMPQLSEPLRFHIGSTGTYLARRWVSRWGR